MKDCPFCIKKIPESSKICPKCGRSLNKKFTNLYYWTIPQLKDYAQKNNIQIGRSKKKMVQNIIESNPKEKIRLNFVDNLFKYPRLLKMLPLEELVQYEILGEYWDLFPLGDWNTLVDYLVAEKEKGSEFVEEWIDAIEIDLAVNENKIRQILSSSSSFFAIFPDAPRDKFFKFDGKLQDFREMQEEKQQEQLEIIRKKMKNNPDLLFVEKLILNPDILKQVIRDFQLRPSIVKILSNLKVGTGEIKSIGKLILEIYDNLNHQVFIKELENLLKNKEHYIVRLLEQHGIEIKPLKPFDKIKSNNGVILDKNDFDSLTKAPEHLKKKEIEEFPVPMENQKSKEKVFVDVIKVESKHRDKIKNFEHRYKSKMLSPEVKAFSEYFYKKEIEKSKFEIVENNFHLGSAWLFTYPPETNYKISTILLSRNKKLKKIFETLTSADKPNIWYNLSTININAIKRNQYISIKCDAFGFNFRKPIFFEVDKLMKILDFIGQFKKDDLFEMEWIPDLGLTIYIRISNRYFIGLKECTIDYKGNSDDIDLQNFVNPVITKDFEYLFSWTKNQLNNYFLNNEIAIEKSAKRVDFIKTIQNFKPNSKPRLSFIRNLYGYPGILKKVISNFKRKLINYRLEWTSNLNAEDIEKYSNKVKRQGYEDVFREHMIKHRNNDKFRALLEIDLNPIQEEIKEFVFEEYPEIAKEIFTEPVIPLKIAENDLYNRMNEKLGDLNITTKDFKHTHNIGKIGESYVCYNALVHEFIQKYPTGNIILDVNENGYQLILDDKEIARIRWLNQNKETYEPYDILITKEDLSYYIEVKSSKNDEINFEISEKEFNFAIEKGDKYSLYFVGNVGGDIQYCKFKNFYKKFTDKEFKIKSYRMKYNMFV